MLIHLSIPLRIIFLHWAKLRDSSSPLVITLKCLRVLWQKPSVVSGSYIVSSYNSPPIFVHIHLHHWIGFMRSCIHFGISVAKLSTSSFYLHLPSMWSMAMTMRLCIKWFCDFSFREFQHYASLTPSQWNFYRLPHVLWFDGPDLILIQRLRLNSDFAYRDFFILVALFSLPLHVAIRETPIWS